MFISHSHVENEFTPDYEYLAQLLTQLERALSTSKGVSKPEAFGEVQKDQSTGTIAQNGALNGTHITTAPPGVGSSDGHQLKASTYQNNSSHTYSAYNGNVAAHTDNHQPSSSSKHSTSHTQLSPSVNSTQVYANHQSPQLKYLPSPSPTSRPVGVNTQKFLVQDKIEPGNPNQEHSITSSTNSSI